MRRFGELLVFLTGDGELWLLLRKGELFTPFLGRVGDSLLCLVGVGVFLRGDGELLPLFAGEGELSRLPFGNADGELLLFDKVSSLLNPSSVCRADLFGGSSFLSIEESLLFDEDPLLLCECSLTLGEDWSLLMGEWSFLLEDWCPLLMGDWPLLAGDLCFLMGDSSLLMGEWRLPIGDWFPVLGD